MKTALGQLEDGLVLVHKNRSETLAVLLDRVRVEHGIAADVPMTYAGRLDPMAEGLVLVLTGDKCKEKDSYLGLGKEYAFEILLGVSTDTADVLGLITDTAFTTMYDDRVIADATAQHAGVVALPYPMYSSRTVDGVPLLVHARAGTIPTEMPMQQGEVRHIDIRSIDLVQLKVVVNQIAQDIENVTGDFRQADIIAEWSACLSANPDTLVQVIACTATVTSGVYIRSLAEAIGRTIGVPALAYSIRRTRIGEWGV